MRLPVNRRDKLVSKDGVSIFAVTKISTKFKNAPLSIHRNAISLLAQNPNKDSSFFIPLLAVFRDHIQLFDFRFSESCYLDTDGKSTCSSCQEGYTGRNCEM